MHEQQKETIISANRLSCKAGYRYLIRDISWEVKRGEHWIVFGMNGSGKTTLLSIIAGFKHYTSGTVELFGKQYNNDNILEIRKRIGWVSASFFDKYYTKESALHIVLSGKSGALGLSDDITLDDVRLAKDLLTELHLADKIDRPFDMLSKGERQNVLIARALFTRPEILILDEPCTGLDIYNRAYLFRTIEEIAKKIDLTIIYVTHYVDEILPMFQKTLLLKNAHVYAKGLTSELFTNQYMQDFLGFPVAVQNDGNGKINIDVQVESQLSELLL